MITVFGQPIQLPPGMQGLAGTPGSFLGTVVAWALIVLAVWVFLSLVLRPIFRRVPGEVEDIVLAIARRPILLLTLGYGALHSLEVLGPSSGLMWTLERLYRTLFVLVAAYVAWRIIKDVVVYYGEGWARKTESRADDIVVPIVNLLGPLVVVLAASLLAFPIWGIDVTSVLLGAGIIGLVLGLALQDTVSNIFSGLTLLVDAPFGTGDLVVLPDGKVCQVQRVGLRVTQLYYLEEHSLVYFPNKDLANAVITNVTKPSVDLKVSIPVSVGYGSDLARVAEVLTEIAAAHPGVLASDIGRKIPFVASATEAVAQRATANGSGDLAEEAARRGLALERLARERDLNDAVSALRGALALLAQEIHSRETQGLSREEVAELNAAAVPSAEREHDRVIALMREWSDVSDPWAEASEAAAERERWARQAERLEARWTALRRALTAPHQDQEMRLDDMTAALGAWVGEQFKPLSETWKNPQVAFKRFGPSSIDLQLSFYVDNVVLEHFDRKERVVTEIAEEIHRRFAAEGITMPVPQMEVALRGAASAIGVSGSA